MVWRIVSFSGLLRTARRKSCSQQLYPIIHVRFPSLPMLMNIMRMRIMHLSRHPTLSSPAIIRRGEAERMLHLVWRTCWIVLGLQTTCWVS